MALNSTQAPALSTAPRPPSQVTVLGGSGLVGRALISTLLADADIREIHLLLRKSLAGLPRDSRLHVHLIDYNEPERWRQRLAVDAVFCALGTTIKIAGSADAFRAVDQELVLHAARQAKRAGARQFLVISALGADRNSRVFYNRVKGEMENGLRALGLPVLSIFRPSLLAGTRAEFRLGERVGVLLGSWLPLRWRPIRASTVARAMWRASREQSESVRVYESAEMQRLGA